MMIDEDKKEEYKKVTEVLVRSDRKMSAVHWFFACDNKDMRCSDDALRHSMLRYDDALSHDISIVDVLKELQKVYKTLDAFRCSDSVSRYVSSVLPEYEIKNPVVHFKERYEVGLYARLFGKRCQLESDDIAAMSFHPDVKNKSGYVHLDVRDAYSDAMKAASDLQSALKKIHDSALFLSIFYPFETEQYFELDEYERAQVDKIPEGTDWDDDDDYGDWMVPEE